MARGKAVLAWIERWVPWSPALFAVLYLVAFSHLVDWKGAIQHFGNDTHEQILADLARRVPLDVREYAPFVASRQAFWLYAPRRPDNWIGRALAREPTLRRAERARTATGVLYFVSPR